MFHCLYYSATINESKEETFRIVFCCFSAIKNIVALLATNNFPVILIC